MAFRVERMFAMMKKRVMCGLLMLVIAAAVVAAAASRADAVACDMTKLSCQTQMCMYIFQDQIVGSAIRVSPDYPACGIWEAISAPGQCGLQYTATVLRPTCPIMVGPAGGPRGSTNCVPF